MAEQKRLFLLDAYALIFRGYYAFIKNPRINSKGLHLGNTWVYELAVGCDKTRTPRPLSGVF